jgi:hypothetical protein
VEAFRAREPEDADLADALAGLRIAYASGVSLAEAERLRRVVMRASRAVELRDWRRTHGRWADLGDGRSGRRQDEVIR